MSINEILEVVKEIKGSPVKGESEKIEAIAHTLCASGFVSDSVMPEVKQCVAEAYALCC